MGYGGGYGAGRGHRWGRKALEQQPGITVEPPKPGTWRVAAPALDPNGLDAVVSHTFARAPYIVFVDVAGGRVEDVKVVQNPSSGGPGGGAGALVLQLLLSAGVRAVLAVTIGPGLGSRLQQLGIAVYPVPPGVRVRDALRYAGLIK